MRCVRVLYVQVCACESGRVLGVQVQRGRVPKSPRHDMWHWAALRRFMRSGTVAWRGAVWSRMIASPMGTSPWQWNVSG